MVHQWPPAIQLSSELASSAATFPQFPAPRQVGLPSDSAPPQTGGWTAGAIASDVDCTLHISRSSKLGLSPFVYLTTTGCWVTPQSFQFRTPEASPRWCCWHWSRDPTLRTGDPKYYLSLQMRKQVWRVLNSKSALAGNFPSPFTTHPRPRPAEFPTLAGRVWLWLDFNCLRVEVL